MRSHDITIVSCFLFIFYILCKTIIVLQTHTQYIKAIYLKIAIYICIRPYEYVNAYNIAVNDKRCMQV